MMRPAAPVLMRTGGSPILRADTTAGCYWCRVGYVFFFQAEDGIRDRDVTGVQTCALPIFVAGIPDNHFIRVVREDPVRRGLLYGGGEFGVYVSFDDGGGWQTLQRNLPIVPIHDLVVKDRSEERRVGKECRYRWKREL